MDRSMRALRLTRTGQPLEAADVPIVKPRKGDVLVRVRAAGICHSDAHYRSGTSPVSRTPLTLGHEIAGTVEGTGRAAGGLEIGDPVCLHYLVTCNDCAWCRSARV